MRRFSQRNSLVTLSDLNMTPLIDLAFVLLIIFMITTPLLEHGLSVDLPEGGQPDRPLDKNDIRTIEVDRSGGYMLDNQSLSLDHSACPLGFPPMTSNGRGVPSPLLLLLATR